MINFSTFDCEEHGVSAGVLLFVKNMSNLPIEL